jgi:hypothetical protein
MCITVHVSENVKGVLNYAVCLMAVCVVKQVVYSTELQKLYHGDVPGMIMVTVLEQCVRLYTALNCRNCTVAMCQV